MARDGEDRDRDSSTNLSSRGNANRDSRDYRHRASSPRSRGSLSPPVGRSARTHDEPRRRYSDSRPESPPRDAHRDRYSDRDRPGPSRHSRYDDDDDYYYDRHRRRSPSPRRRRSPSPPPRRRDSSRRSTSPPLSSSARSSHPNGSTSRRHDSSSNGRDSHRSPERRDRRDLPSTSSRDREPPASSSGSSSRANEPLRGKESTTATGSRPSRQSISIAFPNAHASPSTSAARPLAAFSGSSAASSAGPASAAVPPPPPVSSASAAPSRPRAPPSTARSVQAAADKLPPFFYKPLKSKDYRVVYDPALDTNPIKKGKAVESRYDGEGLPDDAGKQDPRGAKGDFDQVLQKSKRHLLVKRVGVITYNWDKNSKGPAPPLPPCAILITGFPPSTSGDAIHAHFRSFGRIDQLDLKIDPQTGGNLGICWIKYRDDVPRDFEPDKPTREKYEAKRRAGQVQDGAAVTKAAAAKGNGAKIGITMLRAETGVKVVLDPDGKLCKEAVDAEMLRLHPPALPSMPKIDPSATSDRRAPSASSTPRAPSSSLPPPPPTGAPPPPPSLPPPPPPSSSSRSGAAAASSSRQYSGRDSPVAAQSDRWAPTPAGPRAPSTSRPTSGLPSRPAYISTPGASVPGPPSSSSSAPSQPSASLPSGTARSRGETPPELRLAKPRMAIPPLPAGRLPARPDRRPHVPVPAPQYSQPKLGGRLPMAPGRGMPGRSDDMASAIQQAVLAAKKRLKLKQEQPQHGAKSGTRDKSDDRGDVDMEMSSGDEANRSGSDDSSAGESGDEGDARDRLRYANSAGQTHVRRILPRGMAPAGAIAWQVSKKILLEKLSANGYPYLVIEKATFQQDRSDRHGTKAAPSNEELQHLFRKYGIDRTFADADGWYITFDSRDSARRARDAVDGRRFAGAPLFLKLREKAADLPVAPKPPVSPPKPSSRGGKAPEPGSALEAIVKKLAHPPPKPKPRKTSGWTEAELLDEAKDIVVNDLLDAFESDIISRLVRGKVQEHLARWEGNGMQTTQAHRREEVLEPHADQPEPAEGSSKSLSSLSFAKRRSADAAHASQARRKPPPTVRAPSETPSETASGGREASDRGSPALASRAASKEPTFKVAPPPALASSDEEDDRRRSRPSERPKKGASKKRKAPKKVKVHLDYTSSEDEPDLANVKPKLIAIKEEPADVLDGDAAKHMPSIFAIESQAEMDVDARSRESRSPSLRAEPVERKPAKRAVGAAKKAAPPPLPPSATTDPFEAGIAEDEEDLFFLKLALERLHLGKELNPTPPASEDEDDPPKHLSGSARTEGFYAITVEEKMANRPASNRAKASRNGAAANAAAASSVAVSRLARANTRGLVRGMELHKKITATDTDVLKFNQLKTRKKQLTFARSGIEGYGLFALEHIPVGDMVIEYVGELIRQTVADRREKAYERSGIGSSYLFRVDEDLVVDATKKGNLGRLINHCCAPNCTARIITINGVKKIVIYAKSNIEPGEEVTYDYHFPIEEDNKIPCLCGAEACKTWLN